MNEIYDSVTYYGIGKIIKKYAGFPAWLPLPVSIQHGWATIATPHDAVASAAENWYWSQNIESKYRQQFPDLNTRAVGAPFLYLLDTINYIEFTEKVGSIVFPSHSSKLIQMKCDFDTYADMLDKLPDRYKPITICMYHVDQENGLDRPFAEKGFSIVSNGNNLYDASFLNNFVLNTQNKKYAFSNQMTSALLFANAMGLKSFFYGPEFKVESDDPNYVGLDYTDHHRNWESKYKNLFDFVNCDFDAQREAVERELGKSFLLDKSSMQLLLLRSMLNQAYISCLISEIKASLKRFLVRLFPALPA